MQTHVGQYDSSEWQPILRRDWYSNLKNPDWLDRERRRREILTRFKSQTRDALDSLSTTMIGFAESLLLFLCRLTFDIVNGLWINIELRQNSNGIYLNAKWNHIYNVPYINPFTLISYWKQIWLLLYYNTTDLPYYRDTKILFSANLLHFCDFYVQYISTFTFHRSLLLPPENYAKSVTFLSTRNRWNLSTALLLFPRESYIRKGGRINSYTSEWNYAHG